MDMKENLTELLNTYLKKYQHQNKNTLSSKKYVISDFIKSLPDNITEIRFENIQQWEEALDNSRNTINGKLCVLRQYLEFVIMYDIKSAIPIIKKYHDSYKPYIYTDDEVALIINKVDNLYARNYKQFCIPMLFRLLISCGLRLGEAISLEISDYDESNGVLKLSNTKGKKERLVPLSESTNEIVKKYIHRLNTICPQTIFLFPRENWHEHITIKQIQNEFNKILVLCNISTPHKRFERGPCVHCFRHYFVFHAFRIASLHGINIENSVPYLSTYLGHENLMETEKYLKFTYDMYPEATKLFEEYTIDLFKEASFDE